MGMMTIDEDMVIKINLKTVFSILFAAVGAAAWLTVVSFRQSAHGETLNKVETRLQADVEFQKALIKEVAEMRGSLNEIKLLLKEQKR